MKSLNLKQKGLMLSVFFGVLLILCSVIIFTSLANSQHDSEVVNAVGKQRMLSQMMGKDILSYILAKSSLQTATLEVQKLDEYITQMRTVYTSSVVAPVKSMGLPLSMHPDGQKEVPYPATFARMVSERFSEKSAISVEIITDNPINSEMGLRDQIDRDAFAALNKNGEELYFKEVARDGQLYLNFYTPDRATVAACADCHTQLLGTPVEMGDLLGIRRFVLHYSNDIALGKQRLIPNLDGYEAALTIFSKTLQAMKRGGEYPTDFTLSQAAYFAGSSDAEVLSKISVIETELARFVDAVDRLKSAKIGSDAFALAKQDVLVGSNTLFKLSDGLTVRFVQLAEKKSAYIFWAVVGMLLMSLLAFAVFYLLTSKMIIGPVQEVTRAANAIAEGDLSVRLEVRGDDEIGNLSTSINEMAGSLNQIVAKISGSAEQLASATEQIAVASREMATGAESQSRQMDSVSAAINELGATSTEVCNNTSEAAQAAELASQAATSGGDIVRQSIDGMSRISSAVQDTADNVGELAKHSDQIGQIVSVIEDIANQTNLLALNAAIEAARAGEQGRGFAVVADEVRSLASRTTVATQEIADMIKNIQSGTESAVHSMNVGKQEVESGVELVAKAGSALEEIVTVVDSLSSRFQQIATAATEQSAVADEITQNVTEVTEVSQSTEQTALHTVTATDELAQLASDLQTIVSRFRL
ncbi:MAG: methyl-accepting chemotaxis protein [Gammaproteobacteria bacterium]|nr:methyl-accepting chemotaxis protein [Gammaproteobacteria bacterium]MCF6229319.1 methyl-accepting chemotaxis protein [Gammaproteobacteria bacterium]